jgi:hypothetical protein
MWRHVDPVTLTDVSEERIASIFRVEKSASEEPAWAVSEDGILHCHRCETSNPTYHLLFHKMSVSTSAETSVNCSRIRAD